MKKIFITTGIVIFVLLFTFTSCVDKFYVLNSRDFEIFDKDVYYDLLDYAEEIVLPSFTPEEEAAIDFYRKHDLNVGQYVYEYYYSEIDGETIGINYYIVSLLRELLDIEVKTIEIEFKDFQQSILDEKVDIIPGIYNTSVTEKYIDVTTPYYYDRVFLYSDKREDKKTLYDIDNTVIGLPNNLTYLVQEDVEFLKEKGINIEIKLYDSNKSAFDAFNAGEIDYILANVSMELFKFGLHADEIEKNMLAKKMRFAFKTGYVDEHFISAIEKIFDLDAVSEHINFADHAIYQTLLTEGHLFTTEEQAFINQTYENPVVFENIQFTEPLLYYDKTTRDYEGAISEVWRRVSSITGLNYINLVEEGEPFSEVLEKVKTNEIDGSMLKVYKPEEQNFIYTNPIYTVNYVLVGKESSKYIHTNENLNNYTIGSVEKNVASNFLHNNYGKENIKAIYKDIDEAIQALRQGEVDYIILNEFIFNNLYYKMENYDLKHIADFKYYSEFVSFFNKDNPNNELVASIFDKASFAVDKEQIDREFLTTKINMGALLSSLENMTFIIGICVFVILAVLSAFAIQTTRKHKNAEKSLRIDSLTKAKNRYLFKEKYLEGFHSDLTILYIDLNNFKKINDTFGHYVGDFVLIEYVKKLWEINYADVYRFDGDEFVLVIENKNLDEKKVIDIVNHCSKVEISNIKGLINFTIEASVGVVNLDLMEKEKLSYTKVLNLADFTMYMAKKNKVVNFKICDHTVIKQQKIIHDIEEKITLPLDEVGVVPYFQPIFDMYNNEIVAFETLARWKLERSFIYPEQFISILEKIGKIQILDLFMFECSLKQLKEWRDKGLVNESLYITSNFSAFTLKSINFSVLDKLYNEYKIPKKNFVIEITESFFADQQVIDIIQKLKNKGFQIAVDDFSAGHSSLNSLVKINMDFTKIDKDLIYNKKIDNDYLEKKGNIVLKNIIKMVSELESEIIIEGVETKATINLLKEIGSVRKIQGFYYSNPLEKDDAEKLLLKQKNNSI